MFLKIQSFIGGDFMKKGLIKFIMLAAVLSTVSMTVSFAQEVACVDVQKVVVSSAKVQALKKEQEAKAKELVAFIEKARKEVSAQQDTKKKQALEEKYNKQFLEKREKIEKDYAEKLKKIDADISAEIAKQAQQLGFDMVVSKEVVLYGQKDITESVIKSIKASNK